MKEHAEHEEAGTLRTKSRVENDEATRRNARMPAPPPFKPNGNPVRNHHPKPKSRPAAQCYKPALLRIKLDEAH